MAADHLERFDQYMDRCLYHRVDGFYSSGQGRAGGRGGDFITSPEVGPLFGEVIARFLDYWWDQLGRPEPFRVIDAGTGPGTLARRLDQAPGKSASARTVIGVDHDSDPLTPDDLKGSVVIANELLDNLPFRIVEHRAPGSWYELHIRRHRSGRHGEELVAVEPPPGQDGSGLSSSPVTGWDQLAIPVGCRAPILERAHQWVTNIVDGGAAVLVAFDYGALNTSELATRQGWLRTYRRHQRGFDPLVEPGQWDITTDVAVDQLPPPTEVTTQAEFLTRWGIDDLVEEGRQYWQANAARPNLAALKMRSRVAERRALCDPDGLGAWLVCCWQSPSLARRG